MKTHNWHVWLEIIKANNAHTHTHTHNNCHIQSSVAYNSTARIRILDAIQTSTQTCVSGTWPDKSSRLICTVQLSNSSHALKNTSNGTPKKSQTKQNFGSWNILGCLKCQQKWICFKQCHILCTKAKK